jgi:hypothetical protein
MTETEKDLAVYVIVRNDLNSLNPGKAMSQCHHAGVQMMAKYSTTPIVKEYIDIGITQGAKHFNTTIVLSGTLDDIDTINMNSTHIGSTVFGGIIVDPTYPFIVDDEISKLINTTPTVYPVKELGDGKVLWARTEVTCSWYIGDRNDQEFKDLFDGLSLHP